MRRVRKSDGFEEREMRIVRGEGRNDNVEGSDVVGGEGKLCLNGTKGCSSERPSQQPSEVAPVER